MRTLALLVATVASIGACSEPRPLPAPGLYSAYSVSLQAGFGDEVDVLFVVDDSSSMAEEQAALTAGFEDFVRALVDPPDEDGDLVPDRDTAGTLHVGVISTNMAASGYPLPGCGKTPPGPDGVLQHVPSRGVVGCDEEYPAFLSFDAATDDLAALATDFACIATLGTGGCEWQQPLFALEKALTVHAARGGANDGFLRADAMLAILVVTVDDDCSVADPTIFGDDKTLGPIAFRCLNHPDMIRPVSEFVDATLSFKPGHPGRLVVSAIVGVPADLVDLSEAQLSSDDVMSRADFDRILADPRMIERVDDSPESEGRRLVPSCDVPGLGLAKPPRRIVEWVRGVDEVGNNGIVQSICQADWADSVDAIARLIASKLPAGCLARPLVGPDGMPLETGDHADCLLREFVPFEEDADGACGRGRIPMGVDEDGAAICQICQRGDGVPPHELDAGGNGVTMCADSTDFWFYDSNDHDCGGAGKVRSAGDAPRFAPGGEVRLQLQCLRFLEDD